MAANLMIFFHISPTLYNNICNDAAFSLHFPIGLGPFCSPSQPRRTSPQKNSANFIEKYLVDSKKRPTFAAQNQNMVSIAQLVRASDCGSEGR
ncbi:hypothetical protein, partial [Duncaniella muris]|uniref:hypothetical protein n=1 Tax=Duncaniella muris TaxID=2094150 RepID=UPI0025B783D1